MSKKPQVIVIQESQTGRNEKFQDTSSGNTMNRREFVKQIENGKYDDYHIRNINGEKTPVSNPDKNSDNNLG